MQSNEKLRTLGVTYAIEILDCQVRILESIVNHFDGPVSMMLGSVPRKEALSGGCYVCMPYV